MAGRADDEHREGPNPENALTGTIFKVNDGTSEIEVPAADGRLRLWRNTSLAGLAGGDSRTLAVPARSATSGTRTSTTERVRPGWSACRPPRAARASRCCSTRAPTTGPARPRTTSRSTATRAARSCSAPAPCSGRGGSTPTMTAAPARPRRRCSRPWSTCSPTWTCSPVALQPGLAAAAASTDYTPPTSQATSISLGNPATAGGVAADTGGGRVGAVEVSTDGGASWHPAEGRESWTYSWVPPVPGAPVTVLTRAADDSANLVPRTPGPGAPPPGGGGGPAAAAGHRRRFDLRLRPRCRQWRRRRRRAGTGAGAGAARRIRLDSHPRRTQPSRPRRAVARPRVAQRRRQVACPLLHHRGPLQRPPPPVPRPPPRRRAPRRDRRGRRSVTVTVKLNRATRRKLTRARKLRVTAVAIVRDAAGNRLTNGTPIRLLAPNRT